MRNKHRAEICAVLTRHAAGDICGYSAETRGSSAMYSGRNIMRRWCATLTLGALLALPLYAQQKDATSDSNNGTTDTTAAPAPAPSEYNIAPASRNLFALPAAPAPSPDIFSDWANNPWNRHAWGLLTPRYEIAGMFSYINFNPGGGFKSWNNLGATGSFTFNANKWLGLVAEVGGYHFKRDIFVTDSTGTVTQDSRSGGMQTYLFGPRVISAASTTLCPSQKFFLAARTEVRS